MKKLHLSRDKKNIINVIDDVGKILASFIIKENLEDALALLKQINSLKTKSSLPIYQTNITRGISTWSFHQQILYLPMLTEYVKYEGLIKYFYKNGKEFIVELDDSSANLARYLALLGIPFKLSKPFSRLIKNILKTFLNAIGKVFAFFVTVAAVIKLWTWDVKQIVYTPDKFHQKSGCDFRAKPIYDFLKVRKIRYIEIFHSLYGREFFSNTYKRKRLAIYLEALDMFGYLKRTRRYDYDLSAFPEYQRNIIRDLLREVQIKASASQRIISVLIKIFKHAKISRLISIDDMRHVGELLVVCREQNTKAYGFQHGHITKYHAGWMNYGIPKGYCAVFDTLFVWNDYWKHSLIQHSAMYDDANIKVGGPLRLPPEIVYKKRGERLERIQDVSILIPYESIAPKEEIKPLLLRLQKMGVHLFFKPRPDMTVERQLNEYGLNSEQIKISEKLDGELLSKIDAVIGVYSTFLYELIFYEKPVFILKTSFTLGTSLLEDGMAVELAPDFDPRFLLDHINNYTSKKSIAWPPAPRLEETLDTIFKLGL